jgi:hypothetical protein
MTVTGALLPVHPVAGWARSERRFVLRRERSVRTVVIVLLVLVVIFLALRVFGRR